MEDGSWRTQTERLLLMDSRDFNSVGIGLDDLIEAYMQTCLSMAAIDVLAGKLVSKKTGRFCYKLFEARLRCFSGTLTTLSGTCFNAGATCASSNADALQGLSALRLRRLWSTCKTYSTLGVACSMWSLI